MSVTCWLTISKVNINRGHRHPSHSATWNLSKALWSTLLMVSQLTACGVLFLPKPPLQERSRRQNGEVTPSPPPYPTHPPGRFLRPPSSPTEKPCAACSYFVRDAYVRWILLVPRFYGPPSGVASLNPTEGDTLEFKEGYRILFLDPCAPLNPIPFPHLSEGP